MEEFILGVLKAWGPPALFCVVLWIIVIKGEKRESAKDARIQLLENKLTESYDERISVADQMAASQVKLAQALTELTNEIRQSRTGRR